MKSSVIASVLLSLLCLPLCAQSSSGVSGSDRSALLAREEFRRGLQAYNRYSFNESVLALEKALSWKPGEALILEWLGRAYYRSGLDDTAIRQWDAALSARTPKSPEYLLLSTWLDTVRNRRSLYPELAEEKRYVEAGRYPGRNGSTIFYSQPTSVLPLDDGTCWTVAYGSNEVVRLDVNGLIRERLRGPTSGFDRPYDIARGLDGRLYVSEYRGNRVSILNPRGEWQKYIGSKGRGDGTFVGPQNLCVDSDGYLYVVDFGNLRVQKFDPDGNFILSFATRSADFPGLRTPTGIAARGDEVFLADAGVKRIYRFDSSGNYLGILAEEVFIYPESLRFEERGRLLVADTRRVALVDPESGSTTDLGGLGNAGGRIVSADIDRNGNLITANFNAGEVDLLASLEDLAAGLFVQIDRVVSDKFPQITLELRVQDRNRRPVVGLGAQNFRLTEEGRPVTGQKLTGSGDLSKRLDVSILIERSPEIEALSSDLAIATGDIFSQSDRVVSLISAGKQPVKEKLGSLEQAKRSASHPSATSDSGWKLDLGLRLAATDLLSGEKKRAVFFLCTGRIGENAFTRYSLSELASYLANNGIAFYAGLLGDSAPDKELTYLCRETGGECFRVYQNEGVKPAIERLRSSPVGTYSLTYTSSLPTDFGRALLPVSAEVYLLERSGRDTVGYFPPLE